MNTSVHCRINKTVNMNNINSYFENTVAIHQTI